jgi:MerR family transcriptional regulator, thiopeptide resistance regulator
MLTIGKLARKFDLSRSTLLYYDRIGLLKPSGRTPSQYRIYTQRDEQRLEKICLFRRAGLDLKTIAATLATTKSALAEILELQVDRLNQKIEDLRRQQHLIVGLLKKIKPENQPLKVMDKQSWVCLLRSAGMDDKAMGDWHQAFERLSPAAHRHFLESLGIPAEEVKAIRRWAQEG